MSDEPRPVEVPCPRCGKMTDSLKCYTMPSFVLFLFIFAYWQRATNVLCPACMRLTILGRMATNLITANIISPFIILIQGVFLCMSFTRGHSKAVRNELGID